MHNSPVSNYTGYTAGQTAYTVIPKAGIELKALLDKAGFATKLRVRIQYQSSRLPNGQVFGPWIYPQDYSRGAMGLSAQPLPITLISFDARLIAKNEVLLSWQIAKAEKGSFEVERSADGNNFSAIGDVAASGNLFYTLHDYEPLEGRSYYRLKTIDEAGAVAYSRVATIHRGATTGLVKIAPVPAAGSVHIRNSNAALVGTTATVTDMQGKEVWRFQIKSGNQELDISNWPVGIYNLELANGEVLRLIRQ